VLLAIEVLLLPYLLYGICSDDTDTFYHLAAGRWMWEHRRVLDREIFGFVADGRPWTNYSWLFESLLYGAHLLGGLRGVAAVRSLLLLSMAAVMVATLHARGGRRPLLTLSLGLAAVGLVTERALQVRPHLFTYLLLALAVFLLDRFRAGRSAAAFVLVLAAVLLANLHGVSYPFLLGAIGVYGAAAVARAGSGARSREALRFGALGLACALALLLNPFGRRLLLTPATATNGEAMSQIGEMTRIPLASFGQLAPDFFWRSLFVLNVLVLLALAVLPTLWRRRDWLSLGLLAMAASAIAMRGGRFVPEAAILAVPALAEGIGARLGSRGDPFLRRALLLLALYLGVAAVVTARDDIASGVLEEVNTRLPLGPVAFLETSGLEGHVLVDPTVAGLVSFRLHPRVRPLMDMRMPAPFSSGDLWLYKAIGDTLPLAEADARLSIDFVLARHGSTLARELGSLGGGSYALVYIDHNWSLFAAQRLVASRPELVVSEGAALDRIGDLGDPGPGADRAAIGRDVERLIAIAPDNHLAQRARLWLLLADGRAKEAAAEAQTLARRYPRVVVYRYTEGLAWLVAAQPARAEPALLLSLEREPDFLPSYPVLARAQLLLGRPGPADATLEEYARRARYRLSAPDYALLGAARREVGRRAAAADAFGRALWLTPKGAPSRPALEAELASLSPASPAP
jgi:tetratricopeptide (TPR) repeat protein